MSPLPRFAVVCRMILALALSTWAAEPIRAQPISEPQIDAAYLFNFIHLTNWPAGALGAAHAPLRICVSASAPFLRSIEAIIKDETIDGHDLRVSNIDVTDDLPSCRVLFISRDGRVRAPALVPRVASGAVLTVGNADAFLDHGGMIALVLDQGHVRFDVNYVEARKHGLTFSSKMLRVARTVH